VSVWSGAVPDRCVAAMWIHEDSDVAAYVQTASARRMGAMGKPKKTSSKKVSKDLTVKDENAIKGGATTASKPYFEIKMETVTVTK
jgi:hypothetical protein